MIFSDVSASTDVETLSFEMRYDKRLGLCGLGALKTDQYRLLLLKTKKTEPKKKKRKKTLCQAGETEKIRTAWRMLSKFEKS